MTNVDLVLATIGITIFYVALGIFIGKTFDDEKNQKNWIISFFDGYLLILPFGIMMTGLGLLLPLYGAAMLSYSLIKFIMGEFVLNEYTAAGLVFGVFASISCFWWWFRSKVLKQKDVL